MDHMQNDFGMEDAAGIMKGKSKISSAESDLVRYDRWTGEFTDAALDGHISFWSYQFSVTDADALLGAGRGGVEKQREYKKPVKRRHFSNESQHRTKVSEPNIQARNQGIRFRHLGFLLAENDSQGQPLPYPGRDCPDCA